MSWSKDKGRGHGPGDEDSRRGYHHGNLRETLIRAALDLIGEKGPAGFTFADAARWAGVSPAAPYRHFRDRDALMADVARQGIRPRDSGVGWHRHEEEGLGTRAVGTLVPNPGAHRAGMA